MAKIDLGGVKAVVCDECGVGGSDIPGEWRSAIFIWDRPMRKPRRVDFCGIECAYEFLRSRHYTDSHEVRDTMQSAMQRMGYGPIIDGRDVAVEERLHTAAAGDVE